MLDKMEMIDKLLITNEELGSSSVNGIEQDYLYDSYISNSVFMIKVVVYVPTWYEEKLNKIESCIRECINLEKTNPMMISLLNTINKKFFISNITSKDNESYFVMEHYPDTIDVQDIVYALDALNEFCSKYFKDNITVGFDVSLCSRFGYLTNNINSNYLKKYALMIGKNDFIHYKCHDDVNEAIKDLMKIEENHLIENERISLHKATEVCLKDFWEYLMNN